MFPLLVTRFPRSIFESSAARFSVAPSSIGGPRWDCFLLKHLLRFPRSSPAYFLSPLASPGGRRNWSQCWVCERGRVSAHSEAGWIDSRRKANMFDGRRRRRQIFYLPLFPLLFMGPRDFFPLSHFFPSPSSFFRWRYKQHCRPPLRS